MTISTQAPELQPVAVLQPIRQRLIFAQNRLCDRYVPFQLGAVSYLRIGCSALRTYQQLGLYAVSPRDSKISYLALINQLLGQNSEWWKLCYISDRGYLASDHHCIQGLLQPLNNFVEQILEAPQKP